MQHLLSAYTFTEQQKEKIMASTSLFNKFIELESRIANGNIKNVLNPTAYWLNHCLCLIKSQNPKRLFSTGVAGRPQMRERLFTYGFLCAEDVPAVLVLFVASSFCLMEQLIKKKSSCEIS